MNAIYYQFALRPDGTVAIHREDGVSLMAVPLERLGTSLAPHWFATEDVRQIHQELLQTGRAGKTIQLVIGQLKQLC